MHSMWRKQVWLKKFLIFEIDNDIVSHVEERT